MLPRDRRVGRSPLILDLDVSRCWFYVRCSDVPKFELSIFQCSEFGCSESRNCELEVSYLWVAGLLLFIFAFRKVSARIYAIRNFKVSKLQCYELWFSGFRSTEFIISELSMFHHPSLRNFEIWNFGVWNSDLLYVWMSVGSPSVRFTNSTFSNVITTL